jgi:DNA-binding transcriptional LysR family regulator
MRSAGRSRNCRKTQNGYAFPVARGSSPFDWSLVHAFLTVAEQGSLSAAAKVLGKTQPTVGRQIRAMEEQLGAELFQRHEKGLIPTEVGRALLESARRMREAVHDIELRAAGTGEALEGTVRITASVVVSTHHLPAIIARIRLAEPLIAIELVPSDESSSLHFREADIAVRMYRPTQLDLVTQHLGDLRLGAFAARSYLERRGTPATPADLLAHDVLGMDKETLIRDGFRAAGFPVDRDWFRLRCDNQAVLWELVRAGCGIGFAQAALGRTDPSLVELPLDLGLPALPLWLTAHQPVRNVPRVGRVWELLAEGLRELVARERDYPALTPGVAASAFDGSPRLS